MEKANNSRKELLLNKIAKCEISRILKNLSLPNTHKKEIFEKYKKVLPHIGSEKIYSDPEILVPLIIYLYCRLHNIVLDRYDLFENSRLTEKILDDFVLALMDINLDDFSFLK
ncbi:hypothetical protein LCGC14_1566050 [marine sediment metagenome]|uniref:Uncharacterized protein n=1 Tax=marine sediment metagenome TaxID=412755 RepID=A0A0F9IL11_9ZZZZ